jgi:hypothetical protein
MRIQNRLHKALPRLPAEHMNAPRLCVEGARRAGRDLEDVVHDFFCDGIWPERAHRAAAAYQRVECGCGIAHLPPVRLGGIAGGRCVHQ